MPIINLSANFVNKAVCPEGKKKINYYHKDIRGFQLEVRSSGGKTYALRYSDKHNRQCQYKIGDSKDISFEKTRKAAEKARGHWYRLGLGADGLKEDPPPPLSLRYRLGWVVGGVIPEVSRCTVDMLCQILHYKTQDGDKTSAI